MINSGTKNRKESLMNCKKLNLEPKAIIYQSELNFISKCILDYPSIETGGDLFGFWSYSGFPVIQYAIGPGANSNHSISFFQQDKAYLENFGAELNKRHALQHIGEWHSHHQLGLAKPSYHDCNTVVDAINDCQLGKFFLVIGNVRSGQSTINGFFFTEERQHDYSPCPWVVLEGMSPIRKDIDAINSKYIHQPTTEEPQIIDLATTSLSSNSFVKPSFNPEHWLKTELGKTQLKEIYTALVKSYTEVQMFIQDNQALDIKFQSEDERYELNFPANYPDQPFSLGLITDNGEASPQKSGLIFESVSNTINGIVIL